MLLNANVAFLAIQSVDEGSEKLQRIPAQLASYFSVSAVMGSIIIGLLLMRQHRSKAKETSSEAVRQFTFSGTPVLTLALVAIHEQAEAQYARRGDSCHCVQLALRIAHVGVRPSYLVINSNTDAADSVVAFLAAFTLMCLYHSNLIVRLIVGVSWFAIASLVFWCILISWELIKNEQRWYMLLVPSSLRKGWAPIVAALKGSAGSHIGRPSVDSKDTDDTMVGLKDVQQV